MNKAKWFSILVAISVIIAAESETIRDARLVHGDAAEEGQFPWQVGVVTIRSSIVYYCGGAIINEEWVLTAAHCIYQADSVVILYGTLNLEDPNANVSIARSFIVHEEYDNRTLINDIGLVQLTTPLTYNENVLWIFLAPGEVLWEGAEVTVAGWGAIGDDYPGDKYDVLRYIMVNVTEDEECSKTYGPDFFQPGMICTDTGTPVKNPCRGDGGDPAVLFADSKPTHVGIFSFLSSEGCESPDSPAVFTKTSYYREWIRSQTGI